MIPETDFDRTAYMEVNRARDVVFNSFLPALITARGLRTAIDVGCGIGYYCSYLEALGLEMTGIDARIENIEVARRRNPRARFVSADIEQMMGIGFAGRGVGAQADRNFDLVFCAGLLYHLENPFRAIRTLRDLISPPWSMEPSRSLCVIESRVHWSDFPSGLLIQDRDGPSQSLHRFAILLSPRALVGMLYAAGFDYVYAVRHSSTHPELKRRAFWVATETPIDLAPLVLEPRESKADLSSAQYFYHRGPGRFWTAFWEAWRWLHL